MKHAAIIGVNGALGSDLEKVFADGWRITGYTVADLDVTDLEQIRRQLGASRPDVVINTAAYNLVREAETHREAAFAVNATGAGNVAAVAAEMGIICLHYSTDYVFDGETDRPYTEADPAIPLNVYGASKLEGERLVLAASPCHAVLRTTGLYGETPTLTKGENFVQTVWRLTRGQKEFGMSEREICTPSWTLELARQTRAVLEAGESGLFHAVQEGFCTWREFAQAVLDISGDNVVVQPRPATPDVSLKRPRFSALENARLKVLGLNCMRPWRMALEEFLTSEGGRALRKRTIG